MTKLTPKVPRISAVGRHHLLGASVLACASHFVARSSCGVLLWRSSSGNACKDLLSAVINGLLRLKAIYVLKEKTAERCELVVGQ